MADDTKTVEEVRFPLRRQLVKPIPGRDGDDTNVLELREPTTKDMHEAGVLDGGTDGQKMMDLIAKLAQVSKVSVGMMHPADYFVFQKALASFFTVAMGA